MTIAETIELGEALEDIPDSEKIRPEAFHARTGETLPGHKSSVYKQLDKMQEYAKSHEMMINLGKTNFILCNISRTHDFQPRYEINHKEVEIVEEIKLLGVIVQSNMKWSPNTIYITEKGFNRLWILKRLNKNGASCDDLQEVYEKQIRTVLELAVPVWSPGLTLEDLISFIRDVLCRVYNGVQTAGNLHTVCTVLVSLVKTGPS